MTNNQNGYEILDDKLPKPTESVYINPIFDDNDEVNMSLISI